MKNPFSMQKSGICPKFTALVVLYSQLLSVLHYPTLSSAAMQLLVAKVIITCKFIFIVLNTCKH